MTRWSTRSDDDPAIDRILVAIGDQRMPRLETLAREVCEFAKWNVLPYWSPGLR